jgi:outer membrane receptor protein involved in Fe transport
MKKIIAIIVLLLSIGSTLNAQQRADNTQSNKTIKGHIADSVSGRPLEYASVAAFRMRDSSLVSGGITNEKGMFSIPNLTHGRYLLRITFVGYQTKEFGPVVFSPQSGDILDVGKIQISISAAGLSAVEIVADKPFIEMNLDRRIVNVEGNINITGGNAIDVLETVPSVSVDMDGNISYRGSENVTVLIDGRPANFAGSRKATLEQIPASMIETIELITNPSAKFDPEGTSGIINIVLKKRKTENTSIMTSLNWNTNEGYSANIGVSQGFGKLRLFMNYDLRDNKSKGEGTIKRYSFVNPIYLQEQISESQSNSLGHSIRLGGDYFVNDKNTLGFSLNGNIFNSQSNSFSDNTDKDNNLNFMSNYRNINTGDNVHEMLSANMYYTKKFRKPNQTLMLDLNYSSGNFENLSDQERKYWDEFWTSPIDGSQPYFEQINSTSLNGTFLGKLDYTHPIKDKQKIETGTHVTMRFMDSENAYLTGIGSISELAFDSLRSNVFMFTEDVYAAYANYSTSINKWSFSGGLRFEYVETNPQVESDTLSYFNRYSSIYPSAAITRNIRQGEDIQLTYSKRVNRPGFHALSPFIDYTNSPNLRGGNPYLNPEYIHSVELGYMRIWQKTTLMPSIFYRRTIDLISRYRINYLDTFSLATFENIASADAYGFELIVNQTITKWWRMNISGSLFQTVINGSNIDPDLTNTDLSWSGRINSFMKFNTKWDLQTNVMYRGPGVMPQGKRNAMFFVNAGLRYAAIQNTLTFSLNVRDIFNTHKFGVRMKDDTFEFIIDRKWQSQVVTVGATWQFNQRNGSSERRRRSDDGMMDDDMF